jgi:putative lipoprotein (rSAM/lipoprotein system)
LNETSFLIDKTMVRLFNKVLIIVISLIFGISEEVAAQYGIQTTQYKIRGKVSSVECGFTIPKIKVTLSKAGDTLFRPVTVYTDAKGSFEMELILGALTYHPLEEKKNMQIIAEDIDGQDNKGSFQTTLLPVEFDPKQMKTTKDADWEKNYEYLPELTLQMPSNGPPPCDKKE